MPRLIVQDTAQPVGQRLASPDAFGAGVGRAAQQTGQVVQALGEVMNQYAESEGRAASVRYQQELEAEASRISLDPDIAGRTGKFEEAQRKLQARFRPSIGGRATFDQRAGFATQEIRTDFTHKVAVDGIRESRLNTDLEVTHSMMKMALSQTTEEVGVLMLEAREAIQSSGLLYTPAEQTLKIQDAFGSGIRAMKSTNPVLGLKVIDDFGTMLKPEVTAVYRAEMIAQIRQNVAADNAAKREAERLADEAEKAESDSAEDELFAIQASGSLTMSAVLGASDRMTGTAKRRWFDRAKGNGESAGASFDPDVFMDLTDRAARGEDIREDATVAARPGGPISAAQRNALVNTSREVRFEPGRKAISEALNPGAMTNDPDMRAKRVNSIVAYDEWVRSNPGATYDEAMGKSQELIRIAMPKVKKGGRTLDTVEKVDEQILTLTRQRQAIGETAYRDRMKSLKQRRDEIAAEQRAAELSGGAQ